MTHLKPDIFVLHVISNLRSQVCDNFSGTMDENDPKADANSNKTVYALRLHV